MAKKILLTLLFVFLFTSGCGKESTSVELFSEEPSSIEESVPFDISEYKKIVSEYNDLVSNNMLALYNMGKYEYNYWDNLENLGGSPDFSELTSKAYEWIAENSENEHTESSITSTHDEICSKYASIITTATEGPEAEEIETLVKDIYDSYTSIYKLITSPSGDINSFAESYNTILQSLQKDTETLSLLVK